MDIKIINLFTEPLSNTDLYNIFKKYCDLQINITNNKTNYNMLTKDSPSGYIYDKCVVSKKLDNYIVTMKHNTLIISNLAWKHNNNAAMLESLLNYGIRYLEMAPYKYFGDTIDKIIDINKDIPIYSLQALLFPLKENIFASENDRYYLTDYLTKMIDIAVKLEAKILVFGSPKNRKIRDMSYDDAFDIAISFFRKLGDYAYSKELILCIEPNAKAYGCDFITNSVEGRDLVLKVNSKGFGLHLDIGCMIMENENVLNSITNNLDILKHIHFSAPYLTELMQYDGLNYNRLFHDIRKIYHGKIAIEMLNLNDYNVIKNIRYCLIKNQ